MNPIHTGSNEIPKPQVAAALQEFQGTDEGFIADQVLPMGDSMTDVGYLPVIKREDALRIQNTKRAPGSTFARVNFREEGLTFRCESYGAESQIPDESRAIYKTAFDAELVAGQLSKSILMREREARVAAALQNTSTWTGASLFTDVHGAGPWSTTTTDVVPQINAAKQYVQKNCGLRANALILNTENVDRLLANTTIRAHFPGAPMITREMLKASLAAIFGLQYLIEGAAIKNTADEGQAHVGAYVWSGSYVGVARVVPPNAPLQTPGLGRTMKWSGLMGVGADMNVVMYRESGTKSDVIQTDWYLDELVLGTAYQHLLQVV